MALVNADFTMDDISKLLTVAPTLAPAPDRMPAVGGWISVKDKLPDKCKEVLGLIDGATIRVMSYRYDDDGMSWEDVHGYFISDDRVSHWMPLP